jgi:hypothetical protein
MIKKLSDLLIGETYYLCFVKDARFAKKAKLLAFINESTNLNSDKTELYVEVFQGNKVVSTNLVYAHEIGIGKTKLEARKNYGKFNFENIPIAYDDFNKIK